MSSVNTTAVVDNVPPGETLRAGWSKYNAHWHEYDACTLTNRLGLTLAAGDVVALSTNDDSSVVADDSASSRRVFVVAYAAIADGSAGEFARSGICSVKASGSISRGNYVRKSATARAVEDTGLSHTSTTLPTGAIGALGIALANASGGFVTVKWFGSSAFDNYLRCYDAISTDSGPYSNDNAEKTLYTKTISGGELSTSNGVRFTVLGKITNTSGGGQGASVRVKFGGTTFFTAALTIATGLTDVGFIIVGEMFADGSTNAQFSAARIDWQNATPSIQRGTAAANSNLDQTFAITFQWGNALTTLSFTAEFVIVERIVAP